MILLSVLAAAGWWMKPLSCKVRKGYIIVQLYQPLKHAVPDDFAVIQGKNILYDDWRFVIDDYPPVSFSSYRPNGKPFVINVRRQLAVRYSRRTGRRWIAPAFPKTGYYILVFNKNRGPRLENMSIWKCEVHIKYL